MGVVSRNAVDPAYRGRGIAKLLYGTLINGMIAAGHHYARVHTGLDDGHAGARKAYGKVGFQLNLPTAVYYKEL
jgi:GNAT superfamily N-acetyltransferase